MKFDPTISMGHVLTAVVILAGGLGVYVRMEVRMAVTDQRLMAVERQVEKLDQIAVDVAWLKRQTETRVGGR